MYKAVVRKKRQGLHGEEHQQLKGDQEERRCQREERTKAASRPLPPSPFLFQREGRQGALPSREGREEKDRWVEGSEE